MFASRVWYSAIANVCFHSRCIVIFTLLQEIIVHILLYFVRACGNLGARRLSSLWSVPSKLTSIQLFSCLDLFPRRLIVHSSTAGCGTLYSCVFINVAPCQKFLCRPPQDQLLDLDKLLV